MVKCWLRSTDSKYPSIELENHRKTIVGRNPTSTIRDHRVSRRQVELIPNCEDRTVQIKQIGPNNTGLNWKPIRIGLTVSCSEGDILHVYMTPDSKDALYNYCVSFEDDPQPSSKTKPHSSEETTTNREDFNNADIPKKIPKMFQLKPEINSTKETSSDLAKSNGTWKHLNGDDFFVYVSEESVIEPRTEIGAFDLDGTIIKTKSGRIFPKDEKDWIFQYPSVVSKLKSFFNNNSTDFKFVIFTNQAGIKKPTDVTSFKNKIESIMSQIQIPVLVFVATKKDKHRKPLKGGWEVFVDNFNGGVKPNLQASFYCGDAAGRQGDHSKSDLFFALNLGVPFKTPEEFFLGKNPQPFAPPLFCPRKFLENNLVSNYNVNIPSAQEVIIMVGFPASGKTTFVKSILISAKYVHVNRDTLKSMSKCVEVTEKSLADGKSVVVDNTNPSIKDREAFLKVAKKYGVPVRCFRLVVDHFHALHNNKFRYLYGNQQVSIPDVAFHTFKSTFQEPTKAEGFAEIIPINFIPNFESIEKELLYKQYLLDK